MAIEVIVQDARAAADGAVPTARRFCDWANAAAAAADAAGVPADARLTVRVVDPGESRMLNARYRGKNKPADVLSFHYPRDDLYMLTGAKPVLGDLVMCAESVISQARDRRRRAEHHWAHLTMHGVLHLLGYGHDTEPRRHEMEDLEIRLLRAFNIGDPYTPTPVLSD